MTQALLDVRDLWVGFPSEAGTIHGTRGVSLSVDTGETLALVGESGSGKSVTALAVLGLVEHGGGHIERGTLLFRRRDGTTEDLAAAPSRTRRAIRGNEIAMVFQEPMTSLNPVLQIGEQIAEAVRLHQGLGHRAARSVAEETLARVGIPEPRKRLSSYPHQLSGGMRQRVMIAMALSCRPSLMIMDEPTTALDVTIQAQILDLVRDLQSEIGMAVLFITHDLSVVAEVADRVVVMYAGQAVEEAAVEDLYTHPRHPYTAALLRSIPRLDRRADGGRAPLAAIPGVVPHPLAMPPGCSFAPRCDGAVPDPCERTRPRAEPVNGSTGHTARCFRWRDGVAGTTAQARLGAAE